MYYFLFGKRKKRVSAPAEPRFLSVVATPTPDGHNCNIEVITDISCTFVVSSTDGVDINKQSGVMGPGTNVTIDIVNDDENPGEPLVGSDLMYYTITATEVAAPHRVNTYSSTFTTADALPTILLNFTSQTFHSLSISFSIGDRADYTLELGVSPSYELGIVDSSASAPSTGFTAGADGLDPGTTYFFRLTVTDAQANTDSYEDFLTTDELPAPSIVAGPMSTPAGAGSYDIQWNTDVESDSYTTWGFGGLCGPFDEGPISDATLTTDHQLNVTPSLSCTTFYVYVQSMNANGTCSTSFEVAI